MLRQWLKDKYIYYIYSYNDWDICYANYILKMILWLKYIMSWYIYYKFTLIEVKLNTFCVCKV